MMGEEKSQAIYPHIPRFKLSQIEGQEK